MKGKKLVRTVLPFPVGLFVVVCCLFDSYLARGSDSSPKLLEIDAHVVVETLRPLRASDEVLEIFAVGSQQKWYLQLKVVEINDNPLDLESGDKINLAVGDLDLRGSEVTTGTVVPDVRRYRFWVARFPDGYLKVISFLDRERDIELGIERSAQPSQR